MTDPLLDQIDVLSHVETTTIRRRFHELARDAARWVPRPCPSDWQPHHQGHYPRRTP